MNNFVIESQIAGAHSLVCDAWTIKTNVMCEVTEVV